MAVERRYNKRFPIEMRVEYTYRGRRRLLSTARDISMQGMLLKTESITPPKGMLVQLHLSIGDRIWDIPAVVAHSRPGSMGVMFHDPQPMLCRMATTALAS